MIATVVVTLYTSRVVLQMLGISDFGIYNVVGGFVLMFGIFTNSMASTSQRFFSFALGSNNIKRFNEVFSVTMSIYILLSIVVLLLGETIGLWFLKNKLVIEPSRLEAAQYVYQFSLLSFVVTIIRIPFNSIIISYERMNFYAAISVLEVILKLLCVYILVGSSRDKLIVYSILSFFVLVLITFCFVSFCFIKFKRIKFVLNFNRQLFSEIASYSAWSTIDSIANISKNQGVNVLLNIFFGTVVNASRSVAVQVNSQVVSLVGNLQLATAPQLTKLYASEKFDDLRKLYFQSSRLTFFMLFTLTLPLFLEIDQLISWWLVEVPAKTISFTRLMLINSLVDSFCGTTNILAQATGKIKIYQLIGGLIMFLNLPISWLLLRIGYPPESTFFVSIAISFLIVLSRLIIVERLTKFAASRYVKSVIWPSLLASSISASIGFVIHNVLPRGFFSLCIVFSISILASVLSFYFIAASRNERGIVLNYIQLKLKLK
ncbi:lipopolysaccharide biosynthesis protein [Sphingobacterium griseoflavum]